MSVQPHNFSEVLIDWYSKEKRDLPWRRSNDPYRIWLSEIILQQTRVNQGLPYYEAFTEHFPTVQELARASEELVLRTWQGLGYYSRARNLHKTAKIVAEELGGQFPKTYRQLLDLPGVGPYTAAAIASIAFAEPVPAIDGNVYRVISRVYEAKSDIAANNSRKIFAAILDPLIDRQRPGDFNQALMELGARICSPLKPNCPLCPISSHCAALSNGSQAHFPVKTKQVKVRTRHFHYVVFEYDGFLAMKRRSGKDIWEGLFEFHLIEQEQPDVTATFEGFSVKQESTSEVFKHILTHQRIMATFHRVSFNTKKDFERAIIKHGLEPFTEQQIVNLPKPKLVVNYLNSF